MDDGIVVCINTSCTNATAMINRANTAVKDIASAMARVAGVTPPSSPAPKPGSSNVRLDKPTRAYHDSTALERTVGFLAASIFSLVYVIAPLWVLAAMLSVPLAGPTAWSTIILVVPILISCGMPDTSKGVSGMVLCSWPMRQVPKYFHYEEYHECTDAELAAAGKNYVFGAHPHGVFSFCGVCAFISSMNHPDGFGPRLAAKVPTAAASVLKVFPILKDVLGMFGVIAADSKTLAKRLAKEGGSGSFFLYIGGMAELFKSSPKKETVFLSNRKGFIKLAMRAGADVVPVYLFGNTTVLVALTAGPLADLSRKLGVSVTLFWGRFLLPMPKSVRITYARGRPLGLPHIAEPTEADINEWHAKYCAAVVELFDRYKGTNPDYKHKQLVIE